MSERGLALSLDLCNKQILSAIIATPLEHKLARPHPDHAPLWLHFTYSTTTSNFTATTAAAIPASNNSSPRRPDIVVSSLIDFQLFQFSVLFETDKKLNETILPVTFSFISVFYFTRDSLL